MASTTPTSATSVPASSSEVRESPRNAWWTPSASSRAALSFSPRSSQLPATASMKRRLLEQASELDLGSIAPKSKKKRSGPQVRVPYRTFVGPAGQSLLVGKGSRRQRRTDIDRRPPPRSLAARPRSTGRPCRDPRDRNAVLPPELLIDAAHLAAHFSDLRGEPSAEIQHTERRYLRKPKGAAPGAVNVDREKVLLLRLEPARLERLLASERRQES